MSTVLQNKKKKEPRDNESSDQNLLLPIANVSRVVKDVLPVEAKISREAKKCIQECVSEFVYFISSEAADKCKCEKRKTINGDDIVRSMESLGFENFSRALKTYLFKYRELERSSKQ